MKMKKFIKSLTSILMLFASLIAVAYAENNEVSLIETETLTEKTIKMSE